LESYLERITPEHITEALKFSDTASERDHETEKRRDKYNLVYFFGGAIILGAFAIFLFERHPDQAFPFLTALATAVGGAGYAVLRTRR